MNSILLKVMSLIWVALMPQVRIPGPGGAASSAPITTLSYLRTAGSASGTITVSAAAGNLIVVVLWASSATQTVISDSASNVYNTLYLGSLCNSHPCSGFYTISTAPVTSINVINANVAQAMVFGTTGTFSSDLSSGNPTIISGTPFTGASTGALGSSNEVLVAMVENGNPSETITPSGSWIAPSGNCTMSSGQAVICLWYQIVTSTTSVSVTGSLTLSTSPGTSQVSAYK